MDTSIHVHLWIQRFIKMWICMETCIQGFVNIRICTWIRGYTDTWTHEYLVAWIFGCMDTWMLGCMYNWLYGYLVVWILGCINT